MTGKKKKCIAAIICILFVFVTFTSLFYYNIFMVNIPYSQ